MKRHKYKVIVVRESKHTKKQRKKEKRLVTQERYKLKREKKCKENHRAIDVLDM